jgi:hypothetical protein
LDSLATALYVKTDNLLKGSPQLAPWRPAAGMTPQPSDAELVTLSMMQAMLGYTSEAHWLRHARAHLGHHAGQPTTRALTAYDHGAGFPVGGSLLGSALAKNLPGKHAVYP